MSTLLTSMIRQGLTMVGTYAISTDFTQVDLTNSVGALMVLVSVGWSVAKHKGWVK